MTGRLRILSLAAIVSIAPAFGACAYAQYGGHRDQDYGYASRAYDIGYREGLEHGADDGRRGRGFAMEHDNDYRRADKGWNRRYGSREQYRYEFRRGYERGYREGYARYDRRGGAYGAYPPSGRYPDSRYPSQRYPGSYGGGGGYAYRSPAAEHGFREGYERGREAARDRDRFDPVRERWYRDGDRHYNSRYGSRDQWKQEYREAFRQGYDRGYREGR
jgi:hypothetical protein